jgi:hypothetical protein
VQGLLRHVGGASILIAAALIYVALVGNLALTLHLRTLPTQTDAAHLRPSHTLDASLTAADGTRLEPTIRAVSEGRHPMQAHRPARATP